MVPYVMKFMNHFQVVHRVDLHFVGTRRSAIRKSGRNCGNMSVDTEALSLYSHYFSIHQRALALRAAHVPIGARSRFDVLLLIAATTHLSSTHFGCLQLDDLHSRSIRLLLHITGAEFAFFGAILGQRRSDSGRMSGRYESRDSRPNHLCRVGRQTVRRWALERWLHEDGARVARYVCASGRQPRPRGARAVPSRAAASVADRCVHGVPERRLAPRRAPHSGAVFVPSTN